MSDKDTITLTLTREEAETALDILAEVDWPESSYWYEPLRSSVAKLRAALEGIKPTSQRTSPPSRAGSGCPRGASQPGRVAP